jgi:quinol monooxygenase YgiN
VIYVVAALKVKPEKRAELIAGAQACVAETRKEAGNIAYDMHESVTDPTNMVFVERWESYEALAPHEASAHVRVFLGIVAKCLAAPPRIEIITPAKVDVR